MYCLANVSRKMSATCFQPLDAEKKINDFLKFSFSRSFPGIYRETLSTETLLETAKKDVDTRIFL